MKSTKLFTFVTLLSVLLGFFPIQISSAMDGYWGIESPVKMSSSPYLPTISIQKQVAVDGEMTWYDADMPEGPVVVAGNEFVWFRFLVTNESEIPLSDISLYDTGFDNAIANQCNIPDTMDPYASFVCTIGPFETIVGQHENTAVVVGYADMCATQQGEDCIIEVSDENQAYYLGIIQPEASFEKFINDVPADALSDALEVDAGTLLVFKYEVTNIGVSPLIWTELTDDVFGVLTEECGDFPRAIPAGESDSCEISRVAEDAPNGVQNIGYATIMDLGELTDPAWYLTVELPEPGYSFEKFINGMAADTLVEAVQVQAGDTLAFSYEITNTGNVSLTWADLTDDVFGNLVGECSGFPRVVEAGAQDSCVITRMAGDYPAGMQNTGTVTVTGLPSQNDPAWYQTPGESAYSFEKLINGMAADTLVEAVHVQAGDTLDFSYAITNTGSVSLMWTDLTDDVFGNLVGECGGFPRVVEAGAQDSCVITRVAGDHPAGMQNTGTVTVTGLPSQNDPAWYQTPGESAYSFEKLINGMAADTLVEAVQVQAGDTLTFSYAITNTGSVSLMWTDLTDDVFGNLVGECSGFPRVVEAGAQDSCVITRVAGDHPAGMQNTGTVTVTGLPSQHDPAWYQTPGESAYSFEKLINGMAADTLVEAVQVQAGDTLTFSYEITNTGSVSLVWTDLTDDVFGNLVSECGGFPRVVEAGAQDSCVITRVAGDHPAGMQNTGTVTVTGLPLQHDPAWYQTPNVISYTFEKYINGQMADTVGSAVPVQAGADLTFRYELVNTGNVALTWTNLADSVFGDLTTECGEFPRVVEAGEPSVCEITRVAGDYPTGRQNVGTVTVTGLAAQSDPAWYKTATVIAYSLEKYINDQTADSLDEAVVVASGTALRFSYEIVNQGNVTLTWTALADDVFGGLTRVCGLPRMVPVGERSVCEITRTAGEYPNGRVNIGTVVVTGAPVKSDPAWYRTSDTPAYSFEKYINGQRADSLDTAVPVEAGTTLAFRYEVQNVGNTTLSWTAVTDDVFGNLTSECGSFPRLITAGGTSVCTIYRVAEDYPTGKKNVGTVMVTNAANQTDPAWYITPKRPVVDIEKHTNGVDADIPTSGPYIMVGQAVLWEYIVENTGNVPLTNLVVSDDVIGAVCTLPALAVGGIETCTLSGTAVPDHYTNLGTVEAEFGTTTVSDSDPSHYFGVEPAVNIEKYTNNVDADAAPGVYILVGRTVQWKYSITNEGNVPLNNVVVTDNILGQICTISTLAAGATEACTKSGVATAGQYANVGRVTAIYGSLTVSDEDASHYFGAQPGIQIEKSTNNVDADSVPGPYIPVGNLVTWAYRVTNTGNVTLSAIKVSDDHAVVVTCPKTQLVAGAEMVCTASGTAVAGQYANIGTATGTPPVGATVSDTDPSHYFGVAPAIDVEKSTNGADADSAPGPYVVVGAAVQWKYKVTNTGNVNLVNVKVTDDQGVAVSCPATTLNVRTSMVCTANGTAQRGQYANVGTATGAPSTGGSTVSATDPSHYFGSAPAIDLEKQTNGLDADTVPGPYIVVGQTITWKYIVKNTGNVNLTGINVVDDRGVVVSCPKTTLSPAESMTCTGSGTAVAGQYANVGTVTGTPPAGTAVTDSDPSHYYGVRPDIQIETYTNGVDSDSAPGEYILVGNTVYWQYVVTNIGNVTLSNIWVFDDQLGAVCQISSLLAGAAKTCMAQGVAVPGQYANEGRVTGYYGTTQVSDTDPSHYFGAAPAIDLEKHTQGFDADTPTGPQLFVDTTVIWEFAVTNTGNVPLTKVVVTDDDPEVTVVCPKTTLAVEERMLCKADGVVEFGQYANVGTAVAKPPIGPNVSDTDPSHYFGAYPPLDLEKGVSDLGGEAYMDADTEGDALLIYIGDEVYYRLLITNRGTEPITDISLSDTLYDLSDPDMGTCYMLEGETLAPGEFIACTVGDEAITIYAEAGLHTNVATVTGVYGGQTFSDVDAANYYGVALFNQLKDERFLQKYMPDDIFE